MKNLYLNFCKLATLVLMVGLSVRFLSVQFNNFNVFAKDNTFSFCVNDTTTVEVDPKDKHDFEVANPTATHGSCEENNEKKVTICHAAGQDDTDHFETITIAYQAAYGQAGHFYENGTPRAGHENDYLGECRDDEEEEESEVPSMSSSVSCGRIDMTFSNPTNWFFSFDYRVDGEAGHADEYTNMQIANGPFAGQFFGQRFNEVDVMANSTQSRTVTFAEDSGTHTVEYRLFRGAENDLYLNWESKEINSNCQRDIYGCTDEEATNYNAEATHDDESCVYPSSTPTPTPTPTLTPSPDPTEPPGYNCPVAQSCPSACGQAASDVPNGSCGFNHCDPTPSCDGGIGGGSQGQVLGTSTMSGQVLGASTYAATGVVEDALFSLMGVAGAGLSGAGILLKRNEKRQK